MSYFEELKKSMEFLGENKKVLFLGQAVSVPGTAMSNTLKDINPSQKVEMPVSEEMQMGITNGLALNGLIPVSIFPRWNFLLLAINQLVNHLDKITEISSGGFTPKVIIRTGIGSERPLHPQCQHVGDFSESVQGMCKNVEVIKLIEPQEIFPAYKKALERDDGKSSILVEYGDYYNEK
ncbi:hypothetical protein N8920_00870 [Opitutales bacterium]|nr:hypothetical protein [Opitutales bacterium]